MREVLESKITEIDNRLNRLEPMLIERLVGTMETNNALHAEKFSAIHNEIEALRLLKAHDLTSVQSRRARRLLIPKNLAPFTTKSKHCDCSKHTPSLPCNHA